MDKLVHKRINFRIGKLCFYSDILLIFGFYKEKASKKEIEKIIKEHNWDITKISYIKAVRLIYREWGLKQSKLWVELNYPEFDKKEE